MKPVGVAIAETLSLTIFERRLRVRVIGIVDAANEVMGLRN